MKSTAVAIVDGDRQGQAVAAKHAPAMAANTTLKIEIVFGLTGTRASVAAIFAAQRLSRALIGRRLMGGGGVGSDVSSVFIFLSQFF